jgi:adenine/guanine phosphoribosyltransferase-like PRPP-binding protein
MANKAKTFKNLLDAASFVAKNFAKSQFVRNMAAKYRTRNIYATAGPNYLAVGGIFLASAAAGAVGALLFAPKSGKEIRKDIANTFQTSGGNINEKIQQVTKKAKKETPIISNN